MTGNMESDASTDRSREFGSLTGPRTGPSEEALRAIEAAVVDIEAGVELVDAESALLRAIDRMAASKAAVLFLAHLAATREVSS